MPFNTLLLHGFIHGTSVEENGVRVTGHEQRGEKILVFRLDTKDKSIRRSLGFPDQSGICDYLFVLSRETLGERGAKEYKRTLCLVELKGKEVEHAIEQIVNTYNRLNDILRQDNSCRSFLKNVIWKAYICSNDRSSIVPNKSSTDRLIKTFRQRKNFDMSHDGDQNFNSVLRA